MRLSAPIYHLKRKARRFSREQKIPLHEALDRMAKQEGFGTWSLLAAQAAATAPAGKLFSRLAPGDMVLVGARPGHGKTLMSLQLAVEAMKSGHRGAFFTLEYTERDILSRFRDIGVEPAKFARLFEFDNSDRINANYIIGKLVAVPRGTLVVVDYLQLLDQKRENPELMVQVRALDVFAREKGIIFVFISQIDRSYDPSTKPCPDLDDIRLPNPLDLKVFNKSLFLHDGEIRFSVAS